MSVNAELTELTRKRYQRNSGWYDWMEWMHEKKFSPWRKRMWALVKGPRVLEVGVGTGRNIPLLPKDLTVTGIDLTPGMLERALKKAAEFGSAIELRLGDVQQMDFEDETFDTVVATCVFCSVPDPIQGFREIRRVLKPGGQLILLEHVRSPVPWVGRIMDFLNPLMVRMMGANINRRTLDNLQAAGLVMRECLDLDRSGIFKYVVASA